MLLGGGGGAGGELLAFGLASVVIETVDKEKKTLIKQKDLNLSTTHFTDACLVIPGKPKFKINRFLDK